jgi:hypothetical protein
MNLGSRSRYMRPTGPALASGLDGAMVVAAERVGEPLRHGRILTLFVQGDNDELAAFRSAHVQQITTLQVAHDHGTPFSRFGASGLPGPGHASRHLDLRVETPANALTEALGCVVGYRDEHGWARPTLVGGAAVSLSR